jgi:hypothetical protein
VVVRSLRTSRLRAITLAALLGLWLWLLGAGKIAKYDRQEWLPRWADADRDCQSTREEVLIREHRGSRFELELSEDGCRVVRGSWLDPYSGELLRDPATIQIDHLVALKFAHLRGGHAWSTERKQDYANNLGFRWALIPVLGSLNQEKSAKGPAEWIPPNAAHRCDYGRNLATVLVIEGLWADAATRTAIRALVASC